MLELNLTPYNPYNAASMEQPDDLSEEQIIRFLWETQQFANPDPHYEECHNVTEDDLSSLRLDDDEVLLAAESYQNIEGNLAPLVAQHHGGREPIRDGDIGPATRELMTLERCAVPDYGPEAGERALGTRHWRGCNVAQGGKPDFHSAICEINRANITSHWSANFKAILAGVQKAEHEIGMHWFFRENGIDLLTGKAIQGTQNTNMRFVRSSSGYIGLASVPSGSLPCQHSPVFNEYLSTWNPNSTHALTVLVLHELGLHNKGFSHTNGGIGNPSIIRNTPASWIGDPAESMQKAGYGGVPWPEVSEGIDLRDVLDGPCWLIDENGNRVTDTNSATFGEVLTMPCPLNVPDDAQGNPVKFYGRRSV